MKAPESPEQRSLREAWTLGSQRLRKAINMLRWQTFTGQPRTPLAPGKLLWNTIEGYAAHNGAAPTYNALERLEAKDAKADTLRTTRVQCRRCGARDVAICGHGK